MARLNDISRKLEPVFEPRQTTVLAEVITEAHADLVQTSDFSELKAIVRDLAEAEKRTDQRLDSLAVRIEELAEAGKRTDQRLDSLAVRVEELTEAGKRTDQRLDSLAVRVEELTVALNKLVDVVAGLKGKFLEMTCRDHAAGYFGKLIRRPQVISMNDVWDNLEPHLTSAEFDDLLLIDLVIGGRPRQGSDLPEIMLAVEVSAVVDIGDVRRARRRADLLRRAGYRVVPVAAGHEATEGATQAASASHVTILLDGRARFWDEALRLEINRPAGPALDPTA